MFINTIYLSLLFIKVAWMSRDIVETSQRSGVCPPELHAIKNDVLGLTLAPKLSLRLSWIIEVIFLFITTSTTTNYYYYYW